MTSPGESLINGELTMMTSSNGNIFRVTGHLCFDIFFDLCPNKRLRKQSWGWLFETPSGSLWRHSNDFGPKHSAHFHAHLSNYILISVLHIFFRVTSLASDPVTFKKSYTIWLTESRECVGTDDIATTRGLSATKLCASYWIYHKHKCASSNDMDRRNVPIILR